MIRKFNYKKYETKINIYILIIFYFILLFIVSIHWIFSADNLLKTPSHICSICQCIMNIIKFIYMSRINYNEISELSIIISIICSITFFFFIIFYVLDLHLISFILLLINIFLLVMVISNEPNTHIFILYIFTIIIYCAQISILLFYYEIIIST